MDDSRIVLNGQKLEKPLQTYPTGLSEIVKIGILHYINAIQTILGAVLGK